MRVSASRKDLPITHFALEFSVGERQLEAGFGLRGENESMVSREVREEGEGLKHGGIKTEKVAGRSIAKILYRKERKERKEGFRRETTDGRG